MPQMAEYASLRDAIPPYALLFVIIASFSSHRYWSVPAAQYGNQSAHFWKNVAMKGGLILLFITGAGRISLDYLLAKRKTA
jgi:putative oxidoreductase